MIYTDVPLSDNMQALKVAQSTIESLQVLSSFIL